MTDRAKDLINQALSLSPEDRQRVATALLDGVDDGVHRDTISRRIAEVDHGDAVVHDDAFAVYHRLRVKRCD